MSAAAEESCVTKHTIYTASRAQNNLQVAKSLQIFLSFIP